MREKWRRYRRKSSSRSSGSGIGRNRMGAELDATAPIMPDSRVLCLVVCANSNRRSCRRTRSRPRSTRSTPGPCPPPRRWRTLLSCWCSRSWGRPGARRGWRNHRRRQTFGGNSDRRTRRSARQYCKVVRPKVQQYARLLLEWNRSINLTGARTLEEVEGLIDGAVVLAEVSWNGITRVIDIGSGGGLPAIPLAVEMSHIHFTLLEANARKCAFLEHVAGTLGLANVAVAPGRAEGLRPHPRPREQIYTAVSGAAAKPGVLLGLALPLLSTR